MYIKGQTRAVFSSSPVQLWAQQEVSFGISYLHRATVMLRFSFCTWGCAFLSPARFYSHFVVLSEYLKLNESLLFFLPAVSPQCCLQWALIQRTTSFFFSSYLYVLSLLYRIIFDNRFETETSLTWKLKCKPSPCYLAQEGASNTLI